MGCPFVSARQIAPQQHYVLRFFFFCVCEHKINIPFDAGGNSLIPNLHTRNLKKREREKELGGLKVHSLSTQYLFNTDVADKNLHLSSVSV